MTSGGSSIAVLQSMMTGKDLVDGKLGALTMPVLIGWGDQDRLIPLSVGYRLHAGDTAVGAGCLRRTAAILRRGSVSPRLRRVWWIF